MIDASAGGDAAAVSHSAVSVSANDTDESGLRSWPPKSHSGGLLLSGITASCGSRKCLSL